jgi:hypothetical protein
MTTLLALAALAPAALAGVNMPISEAIEEGYATVVQITADETICDTFSVDEQANLSSSFRTLVSVDEVLSLPEDGEAVVAGESIELAWRSFVGGPGWDDSEMSCTEPEFSLSEGEERPVVVYLSQGVWEVDPWYHVDGQPTAAGDGVRPPCGEEEQAEVIAELEGDDPEEPADPEGEEGDSGDAADGDDVKAGGCSVVPAPAAAPVLGLLATLLVARRRRT